MTAAHTFYRIVIVIAVPSVIIKLFKFQPNPVSRHSVMRFYNLPADALTRMFVYILNMATNGKPLFSRTSVRSGKLNQSDADKKPLHYMTDKVTYWSLNDQIISSQVIIRLLI